MPETNPSPGTRPAIVTLTHNVKGPWRRIVLPPKVVLVGLNGSGKTATVQALELALAAKCRRRGEGLQSRGVDLLGLHVDGRGVLGAGAVVGWAAPADSSAPDFATPAGTARFRVEGTQVVATAPVHTTDFSADYDALFPAARIAEVLDGSPESIRKALLGAASDLVTGEMIAGEMRRNGVTREMFDAAKVDPRLLKPQAGESRLGALTRAYTSIEAESRRLEGLARDSEGRAEASAVDAGVGAVAAIEQAFAAARAASTAAIAERDAEEHQLAAAQEELDHCLASLPGTPTLPEYVKLGVQTAKGLRDVVADHEAQIEDPAVAPPAPRCPVCTWPLSTERLDRALSNARDAAAAVVAARKAHALAHAAEVQPYEMAVTKARAALASASLQVGDTDAALERARAAYNAATAVQGAVSDDLAAQRAAARARADAVTRLRDRLIDVRREVLASAVATLEKRLTAAAGFSVGIALQQGKRDVAHIGVRVPGTGRGQPRLRTDLCGAEWARLVSAFVSVGGLSGAPAYRGVVVPDNQLDPVNLVELCTALGGEVDAGRVSQAIVQRVSVPEMLPAGWVIVDVARDVEEVEAPAWAVSAKRTTKRTTSDDASDDAEELGSDLAG